VRALILYAIGAGSLAYGFYEFWRAGVVDQNAFGIGAVCLGAAAGLQVLQDLWRKLTRR